jgi:hypothetical protein
MLLQLDSKAMLIYSSGIRPTLYSLPGVVAGDRPAAKLFTELIYGSCCLTSNTGSGCMNWKDYLVQAGRRGVGGKRKLVGGRGRRNDIRRFGGLTRQGNMSQHSHVLAGISPGACEENVGRIRAACPDMIVLRFSNRHGVGILVGVHGLVPSMGVLGSGRQVSQRRRE